MAANGTFRITLTGKGGHGSQPEACRDPLAAGAAMIPKLKTLVTTQLPPGTRAVVSPTQFHAGDTDTVIPDQAVISGSIRLTDESLRKPLQDMILATAEAEAASLRVSADVEFFPRYGATVNTPGHAVSLRAEAAEVFGSVPDPEPAEAPVLASEDFSYYLKERPGAFALIGAGDGPSLHNPHYDFNDALLAPVARLLIRLAGGPDPGPSGHRSSTATPTQGTRP
jgi:hippurate hydrolase